MKKVKLNIEVSDTVELLLLLLEKENSYGREYLIENILRSVFKSEIPEIERVLGEFYVMEFSFEEAVSFILKGEIDAARIRANQRIENKSYNKYKRFFRAAKTVKKSE